LELLVNFDFSRTQIQPTIAARVRSKEAKIAQMIASGKSPAIIGSANEIMG
jgi:hypothetical protein